MSTGSFVCLEEDSDEFFGFLVLGKAIIPSGFGEFKLIEEESDEWKSFVVLSKEVVSEGIGEFIRLEPDREEFIINVLLGIEGVVPPTVKPRVGRRKRYIDVTFKQNIHGLSILMEHLDEQQINSLRFAVKRLILYYAALVKNAAIRVTGDNKISPLRVIDAYIGYSKYVKESIVAIPEIKESSIIACGLNVLSRKFSVANISKINLLLGSSAELRVETVDIRRTRFDRAIDHMERLDKILKIYGL